MKLYQYKTMRLKRWESPRREGRNDKGRGGSARKRQLKKQRQMLRQKLKENQKPNDHHKNKQGESSTSPYFLAFFPNSPIRYIALEADVLTIPKENND
jgi:hypothetical protein